MFYSRNCFLPIASSCLRANTAGRVCARLRQLLTLTTALLMMALPAFAQTKISTAAASAALLTATDSAESPAANVKRSADIVAENAQLEAGTGCVAMQLSNRGHTLDALLKAETPVGKAVLISQTMHQDVARIEIYPDKPTMLGPGGLCVLVRGVKSPLKPGEHFDITLTFEKAAPTKVSVAVTAPEPVPASPPHAPAAKPEHAEAKKAPIKPDAAPPETKPTEAKPPEQKPIDAKAADDKPLSGKAPDASKPEEKKPEEKDSIEPHEPSAAGAKR